MAAMKQRYLFHQDLARANKVIQDADALITDGDWTGFDPTDLPKGFTDYYTNLTSFGYAHGYLP